MSKTESIESIESSWPFSEIPPPQSDSDGPARDIVVAVAETLTRIETDAETLYDERLVSEATGVQLEKLAAEVNVIPKTGESEQHLRERVQINKAAVRTGGTLTGLAELLAALFGDAADAIGVESAVDKPEIILSVPDTIFDEITLTQSELQAELLDALAAADGLQIVTKETLRLGQSGSQGLSNGVLV